MFLWSHLFSCAFSLVFMYNDSMPVSRYRLLISFIGILSFYEIFSHQVAAQPLNENLLLAQRPKEDPGHSRARSQFSLFFEVGPSYNARYLSAGPAVARSPESPHPRVFLRPLLQRWGVAFQLGTAFSLNQVQCKNQANGKSCVDTLLFGAAGFSYGGLNWKEYPLWSVQVRAGMEADIFIGKQRQVALILKAGVGYSYTYDSILTDYTNTLASLSPEYEFDPYDTNYYQDPNVHTLVMTFGIGLLFPIPRVEGLCFYVQLEGAAIPAATPLASFELIGPTLGMRYQF